MGGTDIDAGAAEVRDSMIRLGLKLHPRTEVWDGTQQLALHGHVVETERGLFILLPGYSGKSSPLGGELSGICRWTIWRYQTSAGVRTSPHTRKPVGYSGFGHSLTGSTQTPAWRGWAPYCTDVSRPWASTFRGSSGRASNNWRLPRSSSHIGDSCAAGTRRISSGRTRR